MSIGLRATTEIPGAHAIRSRRPSVWLALAWLCIVAAGCQSTQPKDARPTATRSGEITEIHLIASPAAVNFGGVGGPPGFAARVYASSPRSAKTVPITKGVLEIQMYDGVVTAANAASARPLKIWAIPANDLRARAKVTSVGTSYPLTLLWAESRPTQDRITIVACLKTEPEMKIYSTATIIFVNVQ